MTIGKGFAIEPGTLISKEVSVSSAVMDKRTKKVSWLKQ